MKVIANKSHFFAIMFLSFASGLPFLLIVSTLPIWLKDVNCDLNKISYIFAVSLPYSLKFLWAPLLDQWSIPILTKKFGKRRSWLLSAQLGMFAAMFALANTNPAHNIHLTAICAFLVTLFAATQDIALDAYRIESLKPAELGIGTAFSGVGFRFGMLLSGAGSIYLAAFYSWTMVYIIMSLLTLIGPIALFLVKEPISNAADVRVQKLYTMHGTGFLAYLKNVVQSFINITRYARWQYILLFIFFFKISDAIPNSMGSLFFMDLGFSKAQLGDSKFLGIVMMIAGTCMGGYVVSKLKVLKSILFCGLAQLTAPLLMYIMSCIGYNEPMFYISQCVQCFVCGLGTTILVIYLSSLCSGGFTATQFAVIYSFNSMSRIILSSGASWIVATLHLSWGTLFLYTTIISVFFLIPALKLNNISLVVKDKVGPLSETP